MSVPKYQAPSFTCPHCGVNAQMLWNPASQQRVIDAFGFVCDAMVSHCTNCKQPSFWFQKSLVWPLPEGTPAHKHMPDCCKRTYTEAQKIAPLSPRAACALLRVALEQLVDYVDPDSSGQKANLATRISKLPGYSSYKELFDACRIIGNKAAHPAEIDFDEENRDLPALISELINVIVSIQVSPLIMAKDALQRIKK